MEYKTKRKQKKPLIGTENRLVVTRGDGGVGGRAKWVKGVKYLVWDGNQTCGGETLECTQVIKYNVVCLYNVINQSFPN